MPAKSSPDPKQLITTTIRLPRATRNRAKAVAAKLGISFQELVERALVVGMEQNTWIRVKVNS